MRTMLWGTIVLAALALAGCGEEASGPGRVVLYTAIDRPYAEAIISDFTAQTGIEVELRTDDEGSKTAGLAARLLAEKDNPRADVWWSNEVFHTLRLAEAGVLERHESPAAAGIADAWLPESRQYIPVGLRARVLVVNTGPAHAGSLEGVDGLSDLLDPKLKGKIAIANPRFGTTGGHVASLYQSIADEARADAFFSGLHANGVAVLGSNSEVVRQVAAGQVLVGLTDNDDVFNAQSEGKPVKMIVPDQTDGGRGTLLIPTTVALVKGAPHAENAKKLIDYLAGPAVERKLVEAGFAAYSVRDAGGAVQTMAVDLPAAARDLDRLAQRAEKLMRGQ